METDNISFHQSPNLPTRMPLAWCVTWRSSFDLSYWRLLFKFQLPFKSHHYIFTPVTCSECIFFPLTVPQSSKISDLSEKPLVFFFSDHTPVQKNRLWEAAYVLVQLNKHTIWQCVQDYLIWKLWYVLKPIKFCRFQPLMHILPI